MPKEYTHLFFAQRAHSSLWDVPLKQAITKHKDSYYFGCIAPDTFFYASHDKTVEISEYIHGKNGNLTNEAIFDLLDYAKVSHNEQELVFVMGFITHCALDMAFHPIITYLVGSIDNTNLLRKAQSAYKHRYWETYLDKKLRNRIKFPHYVKAGFIDRLNYFEWVSSKFLQEKDELMKVGRKHIIVNIISKSKAAYFFAWLLFKFDLLAKEDLAIFYARINMKQEHIPEKILYRDIMSGEERVTTIKELFAQAEKIAKERIQAAYDYYHDKISKKQALSIIKGESLETGIIGYSVEDIKYTLEK